MLSTGAYSQERKSFQDNPESGRKIARISTCKIIYFNLALYLSITENINVMFDETSENNNIKPIYNSVVENYEKLVDLQIEEGTRLVNEGFNPYEVDYVVSGSEQQMVKLLSTSLSRMLQNPEQLKVMIEGMVEQTDNCDNELFLN
jgi:hypothetical protein